MTVYIDSVFFLNLMTDYLILLIAARMAGGVIHRRRLLCGALVGAAYAVAVFLPNLGFLSLPAIRIAAGGLMILAAFGKEEALLRKTLMTICTAAVFAGAVMGCAGMFGIRAVAAGILYFPIDWKILAVSFAICYAAMRFGVCGAARYGGSGGKIMPVEITAFGNTLSLSALCDSGNTLTDPLSGRSVLVADGEEIAELCPKILKSCLSREALERPAAAMEAAHYSGYGERFRLLPYSSVGVKDGMLLVMRSDEVRIGDKKYSALPVALSPTPMSGDGYGALWGGKDDDV